MVKDSPESAADSSQTPKDASQSPRVKLITAVLTCISTVLVSFIAIVPQLRRGDAEQLEKLRQEFTLLKEKAASPLPSLSSEKKLNVSGTVKTENGMHSLGGVEVYLLPDGNNLLTAVTDETGWFNLPGVPAGTYSVIVRDSNGKSSRVYLKGLENEIKVKSLGATIRYSIQQ